LEVIEVFMESVDPCGREGKGDGFAVASENEIVDSVGVGGSSDGEGRGKECKCEESFAHEVVPFSNFQWDKGARTFGVRQVNLYGKSVRASLECPLMRWDCMNGAPEISTRFHVWATRHEWDTRGLWLTSSTGHPPVI
jgi:hypothetical protein